MLNNMKNNLDVTKSRYGEQILPVSWPFRLALDNIDWSQIGHLMNMTQLIISVMERMRL